MRGLADKTRERLGYAAVGHGHETRCVRTCPTGPWPGGSTTPTRYQVVVTRFGRTTVVHAVEAIGERLRSGPRESQVTVAGWRLDRIAGGGDVAASIAGAMDN